MTAPYRALFHPPVRSGGGGPPQAVEGVAHGLVACPLHHAAHGSPPPLHGGGCSVVFDGEGGGTYGTMTAPRRARVAPRFEARP
jgi:hypothetical protein